MLMRTAVMRGAVIGHPIAHSKSPALHAAAYRRLGRDIEYRAVDVPPERLSGFIETLRERSAGWTGLSVTMPHKAAVVPLMDDVDELVADLGVLNTVVVGADGRLRGCNTDVTGIVAALGRGGIGSTPLALAGLDGLIVGAGGTALAALAALRDLGACSVRIAVRRLAQAAPLIGLGQDWGMSVQAVPLSEADLTAAPVVISTLPPHAADVLPLSPGRGAPSLPCGLLLDVAYDPWPSTLARNWEGLGGRVVSGLEMLLYQAVAQIAAFTGEDLSGRADVIDVMCASVGLPPR